PPFDAEAPLPSLPGILGATPSDPVIAFPYLTAPAGSVPELPDGPGPLVGLVWAGNSAYTNDRRRSPGLAVLAPLLSIPNTRLVGLQVGAAVAELERFDPERRILDLSNTLTDFAATARILIQLDLMITSDTAIVHLAGALGRPCWLMLPTGADFRWGLSGERTNWYPSLRLFRQSAPEDWSGPVEQMAAALSELER
ncbi:MAG: glycosyltransferase, partial [Alphaproteobacteria bacterium]|nr:glycosyltransferase [Alphaproteobacteria bacterium]